MTQLIGCKINLYLCFFYGMHRYFFTTSKFEYKYINDLGKNENKMCIPFFLLIDLYIMLKII